MKKNEIFTFTAPNGVEVTAIVIKVIEATIPAKKDPFWKEEVIMYVCYSQNRLFTMTAKLDGTPFTRKVGIPEYDETLVDYAVLPNYDAALEDFHQHEKNVKTVQRFGYTKAEASNILEGKNADGSDFEKLPF